MLENQKAECFGLQWLDELKIKEKTIEGDQCEPTKDLPTVKSFFSLNLKCGE